jgi:hypothetical protein
MWGWTLRTHHFTPLISGMPNPWALPYALKPELLQKVSSSLYGQDLQKMEDSAPSI